MLVSLILGASSVKDNRQLARSHAVRLAQARRSRVPKPPFRYLPQCPRNSSASRRLQTRYRRFSHPRKPHPHLSASPLRSPHRSLRQRLRPQEWPDSPLRHGLIWHIPHRSQHPPPLHLPTPRAIPANRGLQNLKRTERFETGHTHSRGQLHHRGLHPPERPIPSIRAL